MTGQRVASRSLFLSKKKMTDSNPTVEKGQLYDQPDWSDPRRAPCFLCFPSNVYFGLQSITMN